MAYHDETETFAAERVAWMLFSAEGLAGAYGDDEPDYLMADVEPVKEDHLQGPEIT
jgi:hypothetical protein